MVLALYLSNKRCTSSIFVQSFVIPGVNHHQRHRHQVLATLQKKKRLIGLSRQNNNIVFDCQRRQLVAASSNNNYLFNSNNKKIHSFSTTALSDYINNDDLDIDVQSNDNTNNENDIVEPTTTNNNGYNLHKTVPKQNSGTFQVTAPYPPTGDQPQAIAQLVHQVRDLNDPFSILRGCTGTGKTFVMAHAIAELQRPTLILCHNKTLAIQLARELKSLLSKNHVELFVSYYNHYIPESFHESSGTYRKKSSSVNDELDALRHFATRSLLQHSDVVIVASISCIYGLGLPTEYLNSVQEYQVGQQINVKDLIQNLQAIGYANVNDKQEDNGNDDNGDSDNDNNYFTRNNENNDIPHDLMRGTYHINYNANKNNRHNDSTKIATVSIWPPSEPFPMRLDLRDSNTIRNIYVGHVNGMNTVHDIKIFPARHHVASSKEALEEACQRIEDELHERVEELQNESKYEEATRLQQRVSQDLLLLRETGHCSGMENYSRHLALRDEGEPPDTLLSYFSLMHSSSTNQDSAFNLNRNKNKDWLLFVDESHVSLPQIKAMFGGDRARKSKLVKHGYRLPSAIDNRPLRDDEFWSLVPQTVFVSATPSQQELEWSTRDPVDMMIRPTFVVDPEIIVKPRNENQLQDFVEEVKKRSMTSSSNSSNNNNKNNNNERDDKERVLAITLTKRDAEDLSNYLREQGITSSYIHSGLTTPERSSALKALQTGEIDVLVGVNLLREGLDLPQVSLVAIFNADSEGFLRSTTALTQTIGRAARNVNGTAIFYANRMTKSMRECIDATKRRRQIQLEYNEKHNCTMRSTRGSSVMSIFDLLKEQIETERQTTAQIFQANNKEQQQQQGGDVVKLPLQAVSVELPKQTWSANNNNMEPPSNNDNDNDDSFSIVTDHIPSKPGVYFWKDGDGNILYIGKAKRLRSRVKSYLSPHAKHTTRIQVMLRKARSVEFVLTPSDRDALILESNLIKMHQPIYNVLLKDDECYPYICASIGDAFPRFYVVPRRQVGEVASKYKYFGPYPHFNEINTILQGIEETYDLRAESFKARHGAGTKEEYQKLFQKVMSEVFEAQSPNQYKQQQQQQPQQDTSSSPSSLLALRSEFEEASKLFDSKYNECRDVVAIGQIENSPDSAIVHVVQLRSGLVANRYSYQCSLGSGLISNDDLAVAIQAVLEKQHYPAGEAVPTGGFTYFPNEILVQHNLSESSTLKDSIRQARKKAEPDRKDRVVIRSVPIRGPRKETDERAMEFAEQNAKQVALEKSYLSLKDAAPTSVDGTAMKELVSLLSLKKEPQRIECYDISHTQGDVAVGSRVVFVNGRPAKHLYRKFNIKTVQGIDDYACLEEVLERRFHRAWAQNNDNKGGLVNNSKYNNGDDAWSMPDLVVIDGGQGQLNAALKGMARARVYPELMELDQFDILDESTTYRSNNDNGWIVEDAVSFSNDTGRSQVTVPVVALAKSKEEVFVVGKNEPVNGESDSPALLLLRSLRDESHRFALQAHRKRRKAINGL